MQYILNFITYIFDAFILSSYLIITLKNFKEKYHISYILTLITSEAIIYINESFLTYNDLSYFISGIITNIISIVTTFVLCYFFSCSLRAKLLVTLIFQVLATIGEWIFTTIVTFIHPELLDISDTALLYSVMNTGSKVVLFILCLIVRLLIRSDTERVSTRYNILTFTTPMVTYIIYLCTPTYLMTDSSASVFCEILLICLIVLNIVNYILIQKTQEAALANYENVQLQRQLDFQKDKYEQLCESYRQNRRIIHDIKKHYFLIQKYINDGQYTELANYTGTAISDIENTYVRYNTGSLVIDSFITNYSNLATTNNIAFHAELNVDYNRIPTTDYDLCIVLGNILDNCLNACYKCSCKDAYIYISIETTDNDKFVVHCENRTLPDDTDYREHTPDHGIGLKNVQNIIEKYYGFLVCNHTSDIFYTDIMIPIIDEKKRIYG